jgi:hypothetical protein
MLANGAERAALRRILREEQIQNEEQRGKNYEKTQEHEILRQGRTIVFQQLKVASAHSIEWTPARQILTIVGGRIQVVDFGPNIAISDVCERAAYLVKIGIVAHRNLFV